jgi:hypothetical protein
MSVRGPGFVYVANGERFLREVVVSATSVKRSNPGAHVTVITAQEPYPGPYDLVVSRPLEIGSWKEGLLYRARHLYEASPYDKTLSLDTDTYVCEDCSELFELLDYYDLCLVPAPNDTSLVTVDGRPLRGYFPYNIGVIAFRKNEANAEFFRLWLEIFERRFDAIHQSQLVFMEALAKSRSRVCALPSIYNARTPFHQSFPCEKVRIIHGREPDFEDVRQRYNSTPINRSWDPVARSCQPVPAISYLKSFALRLAAQFRDKSHPRSQRGYSRPAEPKVVSHDRSG